MFPFCFFSFCPLFYHQWIVGFTVLIKLTLFFLIYIHQPHIYGTMNYSTKHCASKARVMGTSSCISTDESVWWKTTTPHVAVWLCQLDKLSKGLTVAIRMPFFSCCCTCGSRFKHQSLLLQFSLSSQRQQQVLNHNKCLQHVFSQWLISKVNCVLPKRAF